MTLNFFVTFICLKVKWRHGKQEKDQIKFLVMKNTVPEMKKYILDGINGPLAIEEGFEDTEIKTKQNLREKRIKKKLTEY